MLKKQKQRQQRSKRTRARIKGESPRLSVFRSNKHISAQVIDDIGQKTLVSAADWKVKPAKKMTKTEIAREVGRLIAKESLKKEIKEVVFDRGGYKYHGRIKALAEGAREGGLKF